MEASTRSKEKQEKADTHENGGGTRMRAFVLEGHAHEQPGQTMGSIAGDLNHTLSAICSGRRMEKISEKKVGKTYRMSENLG